MSNIFKGNNNRFSSLIEEPIYKKSDFFEKKPNSFLVDTEKKPNSFLVDAEKKTNIPNGFSSINYSNSFINPKIQKERQLKQQQIIEKEKSEIEIQNAFKESNFSESLVKNKIINEISTSLSFLEKAKLAASKEVSKKIPELITQPIITHTKQLDPFFKAYLNNITTLYKKQEIEERNRLGDDLYEEKYGINDENYMDYFDMLDEEYDEDSDCE